MPQVENVAVHDIVTKVLSSLEENIRENGVRIIVSKNLPEVYCDEGRILQVFENLIVNAIKFTRDKKYPIIEIGYKNPSIVPGTLKFLMKENGESDMTELNQRRPTIGLLSHFGYVTVEGYDSIILSGVVNATRERDVNLLCFAGGRLYQDLYETFIPQLNAVYDLVTQDNVNGLIIVSATMVGHVRDLKTFEVFCERYHPLP